MLQLIALAALSILAAANASLVEGDVKYYLHTQENPEEPYLLSYNDTESVSNSTFDPTRKTMVLVHGFMESSNFENIVDLRRNYVSILNENVIVVNYRMYKPADGDIYLFYQAVGREVCAFVQFLMDEFELKAADTYLIGHSVGCHVAGEAGKCLKENGNKIIRITGLDPANWQNLGTSPMDVLRAADADVVDCIHTSTTFGIHSPICKCNFYVNGGHNQPECNAKAADPIGLCDHLKSFTYYQRTLSQPKLYPAYSCTDLNGNKLENCTPGIAAYLGVNENIDCNGLYDVPIILTPGDPK